MFNKQKMTHTLNVYVRVYHIINCQTIFFVYYHNGIVFFKSAILSAQL